MQPTTTTLTAPQFAAALRKIQACSEARAWAKGMDYGTAWNTCQNPNWLLFLLDAVAPLTGINNELLICAFAREVLHLTTDPRVLACIETREAWANETTTDEEWAAARDAAGDAAGDAARDAAGDAARVAAGVAARVAAGDAAGDAAWAAAWGAAWGAAAWDADWAAARDKQCKIIRKLIPQPLIS